MNYHVNDWLVQPELNRIVTAGQIIQLEPRTMRVLVCLIENDRKVVSRKQLIKEGWPSIEVSDDSLTQAIANIRSVFKDNPDSSKIIETVRKVGYRFVGTLKDRDREEDYKHNEESALSQQDSSHNNAGSNSRPNLVSGTSSGNVNSNATNQPKIKIFSRRILISVSLLIASTAIILVKPFFLSLLVEPHFSSTQKQSSISTLPINAIAVIPFTDLSKKGNQAYFANGISEELMNSLSNVEGLLVTAKMSAYSAKQKAMSIPEIGKALNVGTIVDGSIRLDNSQIRVSVQVIDANNGFQLWSKTYQGELGRLFKLQDEISRSIVNALLPELSSKSLALKPQPKPHRNTEAYLLYLRGLHAIGIKSHQALALAADYLNAALKLEPDFAVAQVELAYAKRMLIHSGASKDLGLLVEAEELLSKARQIEPNNARTYFIMALLAKTQNNHQKHITSLKKALELAPNNPQYNVNRGLELMGKNPIEAEALFSQALQVDPLNNIVRKNYAIYLMEQGLVDAAIESARLASALNPKDPGAFWLLGKFLMEEKGRLDAAFRALEKAIMLDKTDHELLLAKEKLQMNLGASTNQLNTETPVFQSLFNQDQYKNDALAVLVKASHYLNNHNNQQAMEVARSIFKMKNVQFRHKTKEMLTRIVTNHLIRTNQAETAEQFLLEHNGVELKSILKSPENTSYFNLFRSDEHLRILLAYADVLKILRNNDEYERVMKRLSNASLEQMKKYRKSLRNRDYMVEAEIRAIKGDNDGALDMLEKAVEAKFRFNWQLDLLDNYSFREINENPRFIQLIKIIREDMQKQKSELFGRSEVAMSDAF